MHMRPLHLAWAYKQVQTAHKLHGLSATRKFSWASLRSAILHCFVYYVKPWLGQGTMFSRSKTKWHRGTAFPLHLLVCQKGIHYHSYCLSVLLVSKVYWWYYVTSDKSAYLFMVVLHLGAAEERLLVILSCVHIMFLVDCTLLKYASFANVGLKSFNLRCAQWWTLN